MEYEQTPVIGRMFQEAFMLGDRTCDEKPHCTFKQQTAGF